MARGKKSKALPFNVGDVADMAKSNPYVRQLTSDPKLRKNVQTAVASGKRAYGRVSNGKVPARALLEDKRLHAEVGKALGAARDATITLTKQRKRARKGLTFGRALIVGAVGSGIAVATSEKLRSKVLDMLFGAEEEFQYTPPPNSASSETTNATVGAA